MATFIRMGGVSVWDEDFRFDSVSWPAEYFFKDPRFRDTDPLFRDCVGALSGDELREFRTQHHLEGRDRQLDQVLDGNWRGWVLVFCGEWESGLG